MATPRFTFTSIAVLTLALSLLATPAPAQLPSLGDGSEMSLAAERQLGDRIAREIYRDPDYVDDPLLRDYVQSIWQPLQDAARARGELSPEMEERFAWGLVLIRDRSINAFALPGGYMGVHLGLIGLVSSRDELASVLAHELSHVTQRHISRLTTQQGRHTPLILAAMILGALAASKSPNAGGAVMAGSQALALQSQLNFSRDMEREADRVGYNVMTQAGFAAPAFVSMFEKLDQASRLNDNGAYPYLRSHPLTSQRIADMRLRVNAETPTAHASRPEPSRPDPSHSMLAARARILADPGVEGLRNALSEARYSKPSVLAALQAKHLGLMYGGILSAMKLRDTAQAKVWLDALADTLAHPREHDLSAQRLTRLLQIELALQTGDTGTAAALLDGMGTQRPELLLRAQTALQRQAQNVKDGLTTQLPAVLQQLQTWLYDHPRDAGVWQALASVAAAQGQGLRAIRAEAEVQAAKIDLPAAVDRFKAAQDYGRQSGLGAQAGDHIEEALRESQGKKNPI
jgi:predicted Zn-dependent protease